MFESGVTPRLNPRPTHSLYVLHAYHYKEGEIGQPPYHYLISMAYHYQGCPQAVLTPTPHPLIQSNASYLFLQLLFGEHLPNQTLNLPIRKGLLYPLDLWKIISPARII
nr:hypothetical protein HmN_000146500 [Hymenolepis microstoma]